jgi:hypothetical protein
MKAGMPNLPQNGVIGNDGEVAENATLRQFEDYFGVVGDPSETSVQSALANLSAV